MPKIIADIHHLKANKSVTGFVNYIATRVGVDKGINQKILYGTPSEKQITYINEMIKLCPEAKNSFEYEDYMKQPSKQNASALISVIAEKNPDLYENRETYLNYIATRPKVEKNGEHGLFGAEDIVDLKQVKREIAENPGVIWTPIISLKREDAARLGYDQAESWRELIRAKQMELADIFGIPYQDYKWYGAFHNEGHHPHLHMVVYSTGSRRGFLTEKGIKAVKALLANEIFTNDLYELYDEKTKARERIAEEVQNKIQKAVERVYTKDGINSEVCTKLLSLSEALKIIKGKKVYGYLPKQLKGHVDEVVKLLAGDDDIEKLYAVWCSVQNRIMGIYQDTELEYPPLWENKDFKKIRNAVVKEAVRLGDDRDFFTYETEMEVVDESVMNPDIAFMPQAEAVSSDELDDSLPSRSGYNSAYKRARRLLYQEKDFASAFEILQREAGKNNAPACFDLAKMYANGWHVEKDEDIAVQYFQQALEAYIALEAETPNAFYEYQIGRIYNLNNALQDYEKARKYFQLAANAGNKYAMYAMGNLYYYGNGVELDYETAYDWYVKSAEKNTSYVYYRLADMLQKGVGCDADQGQAHIYIEKFIIENRGKMTKGNHVNCYRMGRLYEKGYGIEPDLEQAEKYYLAAAEAENSNAEFALARLYFKKGDVENGVRYIELAITHENTYAEQWYKQYKNYQKRLRASARNATVYLFCKLAKMIQQDADAVIRVYNKSIVDTKTYKEILKKKLHQGYRLG